MNCTNNEMQNQLQKVPIIVLPANPKRDEMPHVNIIEYANIFASNLVICNHFVVEKLCGTYHRSSSLHT